ncbi:ABC-type branched-subunit amino acid transport system substrate-binding protein [Saccharothrix ecbatanensis]|uniref:ABC-type branched-subunit amino acid transport system substrate-binding protein n=1 Tax=Saccharothrix ecbatanensis TaxID=1105145 RepID=A0A7W9LYB9_9PSEU|nr:ABC transporter substrate-binding protein [Saccharothrix ecbatanensis]MBB5800621.1 ABC-type branched-subunit amino acid transport system substrate-binding protein [Saccharothrix ecbatanensis]
MRNLVVGCAVLALVGVSGCAAEDEKPVKTGPGVTADTISLGVLTDMTGPFSPTSLIRIKGYELFLGELNARGGICGRKVELKQADHGYDVDRALEKYFELEPEVLGFMDITGAPMTEAIEPDLMQTRAIAAPASWSATLLGNPHMVIVGTTYDLDVINGLDHFKRTGLINDGDTVGHVHLDSDYGVNALEGSTFVAEQWGLRLIGKAVAETADVSAQIAELRATGAKAVVLSTSPQQTAIAVATAERLGWDVPFLVSVPGYDPQILATPAAGAVVQRVQVVSPIAPFWTDLPGPRAVAEAFTRKHPDLTPTGSVDHGYVVGMAFAAILEKACEARELTRDGVLRAFQDTNEVATNDLTGDLRFSLVGRPSTTKSYISRPDPATPGGLAVVANLFESDLVKLKGTRAK